MESRVAVSRASLLPIFSFLCPSVLSLGSGTGQTDGQTDRQRLSMQYPTLWGRWHNNYCMFVNVKPTVIGRHVTVVLWYIALFSDTKRISCTAGSGSRGNDTDKDEDVNDVDDTEEVRVRKSSGSITRPSFTCAAVAMSASASAILFLSIHWLSKNTHTTTRCLFWYSLPASF